MTKWASTHGHSFFSLMDGLSKPSEIISRSVDVGLYGFAITDHGGVSASVSILKARDQYIETMRSKGDEISAQKAEKAKQLKLILGNEFYIVNPFDEKKNDHLVVLAKNKNGYLNLIKATSESSRKDNFFRKPRLKLSQLAEYAKDLIVISGHPGSSLYNCLWSNLESSFNAETYKETRTFVHDDWESRAIELAGQYKEIFGENFFIEKQLIDQDRLFGAIIASKIFDRISKKLSIKCVATADSHYPTVDRAEDQRILLCNFLGKTLPKIKKAIDCDEDIGLGGFFKSNKYYIPTPEEIAGLHTEEEIANSVLISDMCEEYSLSNKPIIPQFSCPDGLTSDQYFTQLCREGWKEKINPKKLSLEDKTVYADRIRHELEVLNGAGLADYFLLVKDIIDYVKNDGGFVGVGRGSSGGCLSAYLLGITAVDPIFHKLIFERFFDESRKSALPDIDIDTPASYKEKILNYIKDKYNKEKVGKISTYGRLLGRGALKDVLRAHEACSFDEMNKICSFITDESAISDELQDMKDESEDGESSIILWALQNNRKELSEWCYLDESNKCQGQFATYFEQAMRLEGTYRSRGQHPCGIVIFPDKISDIVPVIYDKDEECTIAFNMNEVEYVGGVKMDVLTTLVLDKIADAEQLIRRDFMNG